MKYKIYVDHREKHDNSERDVIKELEDQGIEYELTQLKIGDFLVEDLESGKIICIERKILSDLVGSVYDGRLSKELYQMETNFSKNFVVVVGDWSKYYKERAKLKRQKIIKNVNSFSVAQRLGVFASIAARYDNVRLVQVENDSQFVKILLKLAEKSCDGKQLGELVVQRRKTTDKVYYHILTSFPMISDEKAKIIIDQYPKFCDFQVALADDSFEVKGIGEKTINSFKEILL
jgi:ERCC4-type nuclease